MMLKRILGNLWVWVIAAFLLVIVAWYWTVRIAQNYNNQPIQEGETLQRQQPHSIPAPSP